MNQPKKPSRLAGAVLLILAIAVVAWQVDLLVRIDEPPPLTTQTGEPR